MSVNVLQIEVPEGSKHSFEFIQWSEIKLYEIIQASCTVISSGNSL